MTLCFKCQKPCLPLPFCAEHGIDWERSCIAKSADNGLHYLKEAEEEARDLETTEFKSRSFTEMRHLLGHIWSEFQDILKYVVPDWIEGDGTSLTVGSWAYVQHPDHGVLHGYLSWH